MLKQLKNALGSPRAIMKVVAVNTDGTVTCVSGSGLSVNAIGDAAIDSNVYVQDKRVLGQAPDLPHFDITV